MLDIKPYVPYKHRIAINTKEDDKTINLKSYHRLGALWRIITSFMKSFVYVDVYILGSIDAQQY